MTADYWSKTIKQMLTDKQIEPEAYEPIIRTLADILEQRDKTYEQYIGGGCEAVVEYTNKGGNTNATKNPLLVIWDQLNTSALAYWRELGLTPSAYKKITGDAPAKRAQVAGLAAALAALE